jgi:hypothetical protein
VAIGGGGPTVATAAGTTPPRPAALGGIPLPRPRKSAPPRPRAIAGATPPARLPRPAPSPSDAFRNGAVALAAAAAALARLPTFARFPALAVAVMPGIARAEAVAGDEALRATTAGGDVPLLEFTGGSGATGGAGELAPGRLRGGGAGIRDGGAYTVEPVSNTIGIGGVPGSGVRRSPKK